MRISILLLAIFLACIRVNAADPTFPITVKVSDETTLIVDGFKVLQRPAYTLLNVRCRWIGVNPLDRYRITPTLAGINHKESKEGSTWYVPLPEIFNKKPGTAFELEIKNPPAEGDSLPLQISFRPKSTDIPPLEALSIRLPRSAESAN
ncbi:MAG: hypothetical protein ACFUZC_21805 [Chthoniobacteraceae bacterium]